MTSETTPTDGRRYLKRSFGIALNTPLFTAELAAVMSGTPPSPLWVDGTPFQRPGSRELDVAGSYRWGTGQFVPYESVDDLSHQLGWGRPQSEQFLAEATNLIHKP